MKSQANGKLKNQMNHYSRSFELTWLKIVLGIHELWNLEISSASYRRHDFTIFEILTLTWKIIWIIILEVSNQQDMAVWQIFLKIILRTHELWNLDIASASYRRHDFIILKIMTLTQNRIWIIILEVYDGLIPKNQ